MHNTANYKLPITNKKPSHPLSMSNTPSALRAEIITTGSEILLGEIVDTNAAWIAQQLRAAGINLYYKSTVGDNEMRLAEILEIGLRRSDVLIVTGGLGPTRDDITRDAIARVTERPLIFSDAIMQTLRTKFERFGATLTENNKRQALLPDGATIIDNPVGTAPGFIVECTRAGLGGTIIALPGVPREMKHLVAETMLPFLAARNRTGGTIVRRVLHTIGIGESALDNEVAELMDGANPTVGLAAHEGTVDVRITARGPSQAEAEALIDSVDRVIRERVGRFIFSDEAEATLESVVAALLAARGATVAVLETNTEGRVVERLNGALPDARPVALEWTADDASRALATEAVTQQAAERAAVALRAQTEATYGLAVLGTQGQDEGIFGNEAGETWLALADESGTVSIRYRFGGRDAYTMHRIANRALELLWRTLTDENGEQRDTA